MGLVVTPYLPTPTLTLTQPQKIAQPGPYAEVASCYKQEVELVLGGFDFHCLPHALGLGGCRLVTMVIYYSLGLPDQSTKRTHFEISMISLTIIRSTVFQTSLHH